MTRYYIEISTRMRFLSFVGTILSCINSSMIVVLLCKDGDLDLVGWKLTSLFTNLFMVYCGARSSTLVDQITLSHQAPIALRMRVRSLVLAFWIVMTYVELLMIQIEFNEGGLIFESFSYQSFFAEKSYVIKDCEYCDGHKKVPLAKSPT